jgi:hypothetical protein
MTKHTAISNTIIEPFESGFHADSHHLLEFDGLGVSIGSVLYMLSALHQRRIHSGEVASIC